MKLVKFADGKYGVRKGNWFTGYEFCDLKENNRWRTRDSAYFKDCRGTLEAALFRFDIGRPISDKELRTARLMKALGDSSDEG